LSEALARDAVMLVVSGPSGSGKDTLVDALRKCEPGLAYSISATTRPARAGEQDGVHYHFVNAAAFERMRLAGEFLETREYAGNWYGTPKRFVLDTLRANQDLILKPEVNGALAIKKAFSQAVLTFLTVPSDGELRQRLERRSTDSPEAIAARIAIAREEAAAMASYDYLIVNDDFDVALRNLRAILVAERLKVARLRRTESND
jgi:guanylate kinase